MNTTRILPFALLAVLGAGAGGCSNETAYSSPAISEAARKGDEASASMQYGPSVRVGNGQARAFVIADPSSGAPIEIGVALDEQAMEGLPAPRAHASDHAAAKKSEHEHLDSHVFLLPIPGKGVAPFQFVELDWNPGGHEPPGVYDEPHFDFHFWTASREERASIVPTDSQFQARAEMLPPDSQRPLYYAVAAPPGAPAPGVPLMGVHWIDTRAPELQKMFGNAEAYRPFTTTFLYGSWAGRFVFLEPMITRAYIVAKKTATDPAVRSEVIPIPTQTQVATAGYYPSAYRVAWDETAKEYRIALADLAWRE
jgi:hypothetical protein